MTIVTNLFLYVLIVCAGLLCIQGALYLALLRKIAKEDRKVYIAAQTEEDDLFGIQAPQPEDYDAF